MAGAGHEAAVVLSQGRAAASRVRVFGASGRTHARQRIVTSESLDLSPGDTLLFFSDGVPEAFDEADELFGEERLLSHLAGQPGTTAAETVAVTADGGASPRRAAKQSDDISIVASRWDPSLRER